MALFNELIERWAEFLAECVLYEAEGATLTWMEAYPWKFGSIIGAFPHYVYEYDGAEFHAVRI